MTKGVRATGKGHCDAAAGQETRDPGSVTSQFVNKWFSKKLFCSNMAWGFFLLVCSLASAVAAHSSA